MAWLYGARIANEVVDDAVQIFGARAYQRGHDLEYLYRRARGLRIGGGTDEIQLNSIAAELKRDGLPSV
jgi:alkylation response protein AidB-like acyl-CoA dehydrogenase